MNESNTIIVNADNSKARLEALATKVAKLPEWDSNGVYYRAALEGKLIIGSVRVSREEYRGSDYTEHYEQIMFSVTVRGSGEYKYVFMTRSDAILMVDIEIPQVSWLNQYTPVELSLVINAEDRNEFNAVSGAYYAAKEAERAALQYVYEMTKAVKDSIKEKRLSFIVKGRKAPVGVYYVQRRVDGEWGRSMFLVPTKNDEGQKDMTKLYEWISESNESSIGQMLMDYVPRFTEGSDIASWLEVLAENPACYEAWMNLCDAILETGCEPNYLTNDIKAFCGIKPAKAKRTKKVKS